MCGIVAQSGSLDAADKAARFNRAVDLTRHRGIRTTISQAVGGVIAHARLPIVGLSEGYDQPVTRVTGSDTWMIAFVGEVLDFRERRSGAVCDLEVVTRSWLMRGPQGLRDHDGFWSVVAINSVGNLHILCDYLAQKPMYYRQDVRAAASELDAVAALGDVTPDEIYFSAVAKWGYCPDVSRTPYQEVKHVLPGEHVVIQANGEVRRKIVDPLEPVSCTPEELKREIEAAVRRRVLSSDVPVACLLSGGLDSSIAFALAKRQGDVRPYYAPGTSDDDTEERLAVSAVAGRTRVTEVAPVVLAGFAEMTRWMQEPIDLGSLAPQIQLALAVEERVCLTGDGADEGFGGYGRAERYDSQGSDLFQELPAWHLPRLDRIMMRRRVEVRSPFLARRVVQAAMGLPRRHRIGKEVLRDLFRDDLPPGIADRKKVPMRTSLVEHYREQNTLRLVEAFRREKWPEEFRVDDPMSGAKAVLLAYGERLPLD